jgi:hypothetical protein
MTLKALMQEIGSRRSANANPANFANDDEKERGKLATLAALALAEPRDEDSSLPPIDAWRAAISAWAPGGNPHMIALRDDALAFLNSDWAARASGWDTEQLFGIFAGAPKDRYGAMGLVSLLTFTPHKSEIIAINSDFAHLKTRTGAVHRKPRKLPDAITCLVCRAAFFWTPPSRRLFTSPAQNTSSSAFGSRLSLTDCPPELSRYEPASA